MLRIVLRTHAESRSQFEISPSDPASPIVRGNQGLAYECDDVPVARHRDRKVRGPVGLVECGQMDHASHSYGQLHRRRAE